jgi:hypothetical protein
MMHSLLPCDLEDCELASGDSLPLGHWGYEQLCKDRQMKRRREKNEPDEELCIVELGERCQKFLSLSNIPTHPYAKSSPVSPHNPRYCGVILCRFHVMFDA